MAIVKLAGLNKATARLSTGQRVTYWYAWRGGPRLVGKPGSPEFLASYQKAVQGRTTRAAGTLAALVGLYRASPEWVRMGANTKREWTRWLDRIAEAELGAYPYAALNDPDCRGDILEWRDQWADRPRSADYAMQVLSRVLSWGKTRALLKINAATGIEDLYANDRADQVWTDDELALVMMAAPTSETAFILPLACLTGLRREDLATLRWSEVGDVAIVKPTAKSGGTKVATVPLLADTRELLDTIKRHAGDNPTRRRENDATVLTNTRGVAWTPSGLSHAVGAIKALFGIDKHLHDARGTFGTRLRMAGLTAPEIADVLGWEEDRVKRLLATYVDRDAIVRAIAQRIARNETGA